jgi:MerR family mercuric resistance operon transcriptional regulator
MRIGELAALCDCPIETIRYYENIGLLPLPDRESNGYRHYASKHQKWLQFILRSRELGFSQDEVRRLTDLAHTDEPACHDVHELLVTHMADVRSRIRELERMQRSLLKLKTKCQDGTLNDCPVIDELMS